jgi:signal transduction histidine kinase
MEQLQISVADTGVGIEAQVVAQLLNIYVHKSTRGRAEEQGTGLGLIICKEMVEKNGGHIWIESEVGKGTTVHFTIPITKD